MLRFWIRDELRTGQPVISMVEPGPGVTFAEWSDVSGTPAYLVDDYAPGALRVYFVNGDPRAAEWEAMRLAELRHRERLRAKRADEDDASFLLIADS
ncbi:MAG: hypothetical protein JO144_06350 [Actinobacteria bacterium]|nr:hypothetical protein [Actinomycetota bacterium]